MKERVKRLFPLAGLLLGLLIVTGCSSTAVNREASGEDVARLAVRGGASQPEAPPADEAIDPRAFHYYINGLLYEGIGNYAKAAGSFKSALKYHPESYEIRFSLAEAYYNLRRYDQAVDVLKDITPADADVQLLRGASYASMGMPDLAHAAYLELARLEPNSSTAYSHLAGYYRQKGDSDSLVWAYENLARTHPENERIWRELGRLQAQQGDYSAARESFERSVTIRGDRTNILSYLGLAELYLIQEKTDSAVAAYKAALEVEPYNVVANRELAAIMVRLDSLQAALPYSRRVVEASPLDRDAVRRLGVIYFSVDSLDQADSILTYLVESGERNSVNHYYLGRIAVLREDYPRAVEEFTTLTIMADSVYESWLDLGWVYRKTGENDKEILTYQTGLSHMRDDQSELKMLFALGAAYEQAGQFDKAVLIFEEIIAKSPDHASALNYLGYMLADRGERLEYAKELIEKAIKLVPENAAYLDSYGWVFYRLRQFDKALVHLRKAVSLENDPVIFDHLGDAYKATGDYDKARTWWQKALELQPENEEIKKKLAD